MDATSRADVAFYAQPAAWTYHEETLDDELKVNLDLAFARLGDLRLVAAYLLDVVCGDARRRAAELAAQIKRVKVGSIELEKTTSAVNGLTAQADAWCAQATSLRAQVSGEARRRRSGSGSVPMEVGF